MSKKGADAVFDVRLEAQRRARRGPENIGTVLYTPSCTLMPKRRQTLTSPRTNAIEVDVREHAACATVGGEATQNWTVAAVAAAAPLGTGSAIALAVEEGGAPLSPPAPAAAFFFAFAASFWAFFSSRCCSCVFVEGFVCLVHCVAGASIQFS